MPRDEPAPGGFLLTRRSQTEPLPGIEGRFKERPEDFVVEEVPLYEPCGEGEHLYVWIEKQGLTTEEAIRRLARACELKPRDIGAAGLKDRRAITRQWLSLSRAPQSEPKLARLQDPALKILEIRRHRNKLKKGHLKGNRFRIRIRQAGPEAAGRARAILSVLEAEGLANAFGRQRFGVEDSNPELGKRMLQGPPESFLDLLLGGPVEPVGPGRIQESRRLYRAEDYKGALAALPGAPSAERSALRSLVEKPGDPSRAIVAIPRRQRLFFASALQSALFNAYLDGRRRLDPAPLPGEVVFLHDRGASFLVEDPAAEKERWQSFELSPSGPIFGPQLLRPTRPELLGLEDQILEEAGLSLEDFAGPLGLRGQRRALRIPLRGVEVIDDEDDVQLSFELPKGAYATAVVEELLRRPLR